MPSKALEVNIAYSRVDVTVDKIYKVLQEVMGEYYGVRERLQTFLEEICHPYKNWLFIVREARGYALNYFHVLKVHPKGPEAARLYIDIFFQAINSSKDEDLRTSASDNILSLVEKIIKNAGTHLYRFLPVLDHAFGRIRYSPNETFVLFVRSFYQLSRLGKDYSQAVSSGSDFTALNRLLINYFRYTYNYWLGEIDPGVWFAEESGKAEFEEIFQPVSHRQLKACQERLKSIISSSDEGSKTLLDQIVKLPGYGQIITSYSEIPQKLLSAGDDKAQGNYWKLLFLLRVMDTSGLSPVHEEALRDINRTIAWLIHHEGPQAIQQSLEKTFAILRRSIEKFPGTALNCVLNMGKEVYKTEDSELVEFFIDSVVSLGFQTPEIKGIDEDWQIRANPAHIQNIRTWIQLIEINPKWSKKLLSSLIIYPSLSGVLIKDTDLFPRDITQLLNTDIGPVYNLVKQLARLFPTYFNDIGAEGRLRDISTEIDEICLRNDPLIHFLRKQSHVESSNRLIGLMETVLNFWKTKDKENIRPFVPSDIYDQVETEGNNIDGVHEIVTHLFRTEGLKSVSDLLNIGDDRIKILMGEISGITNLDFKKFELGITFYKLLYQKYHLEFTEIKSYLTQLRSSGLPDIEKLEKTLGEKDSGMKLELLLGYLEKLRLIILSSEDYEVRENIYRKRHFTVDIPSMYGSYHELKFDALGLTFRLESLVNVLFEKLVETIDLKLITRATFSQIFYYLRLFDSALKLDGISSLEIRSQLDLLAHSLRIRGFSLTQYLDIFRGFSQGVRNIINDYFNNIHQGNLFKILDQIPAEKLLSKYLPPEGPDDRKKMPHRITEIFLRDRIATSLGLQQLDIFLGRILNTLYHQSDELPKEDLSVLLNYNPQKVITPIYPTKKGVSDVIHLGNKGFNLVKLNSFGLPVPPGFIITTEVFRCRDIVDRYIPAKKNFEEQVALELATLEKLTGKTFGDHYNPLILAVRSGSTIAQPGMMDTFVDVGINENIVHGMVKQTGNAWFSWDTYRRFLQSYGMAFGLKRDEFDDIMIDFKRSFGIRKKRDFSGQQMKNTTLAYKSLILDSGIKIKESPFEQLLVAIRKVFDSWHTPKAETYRKIMGISDDWGTAVTVQTMVFGNLSWKSGAGVFFTHNPRWPGNTLILWGDFTLGNQGEDVVSGLVTTLPISKKQADIENRQSDATLESLFPKVYSKMREWAKELVYNRKWGPQEIEFTFESPDTKDLYSLQTRNMVIREREKVYSFDIEKRASAKFLGHGIGVSGGAMTGRAVFSLEEIQHWRKAEQGTSLILIRNDTVPDDIKEVYEADGLLTARGGSTSHAAIVAHRLGKTCVVGYAHLVCLERERTCSLDGEKLKTGDWISIDGQEGSIYLGQIKIKEMERNLK